MSVRQKLHNTKNELSTNQHQSPEARFKSRNAKKEVKQPKATHEFAGKTQEERRQDRLAANSLIEQ